MAIKNGRRKAVGFTSLVGSLFILGMVSVGPVSAQPRPQPQGAGVEQEFERATQLHQSGDLQGAVRGYLAILANHPARVDVRSNLGAAYSALGRYEQAIEQYKRALVIDSSNYAIRFNLAMAYYKAAWFSEATGELERFLKAVPTRKSLTDSRL